MGKIIKTVDKKTGQEKYYTYLPKDIMEDLVINPGDSLLIKSVVGNELTFKLKRKE